MTQQLTWSVCHVTCCFDAYPLMFVELKSDMFPVLFLRLLLNGRVFVLVFGTSVKYVPVNKK